jgi:endoglucanase
VSLGKGPAIFRGPNFNPKVVDQLLEAADASDIPYQLVAAGRPPGTDANAMQISRSGMATGLVSIPNRYMHSPVEVVSLDDMDKAADLLARFAERLDPKTDFVP